MLSGRLAAYVELQDIFEADPLFGSDACFARCASSDQLAEALTRARELPDGEYGRIAEIQRHFAASIVAPLDERSFIEELWGGAESRDATAEWLGRHAVGHDRPAIVGAVGE